MSIVKKFNGLNGAEVTRKEIERLIAQAKEENDTAIIYRLSKVLNDNPDIDIFTFKIKQYPDTGLNAPHHSGLYKEALDSCGRLRPGFKFENGSVVRVATRLAKNVRTARISQEPVKPVKTVKKPVRKPVKKEVAKPVVNNAAEPSKNVAKATEKTIPPAKVSDNIIGYAIVDNIGGGIVASKSSLAELEKVYHTLEANDSFKDLPLLVYDIIRVRDKNKLGKQISVDWKTGQKPKPENKPLKKKVEPAKKVAKAKVTASSENPEPFAVKPKSTSVATAIKDVLSTGKFKGLNERQAMLLYKHLGKYEEKDYDGHGFSPSITTKSGYEIGMLKKESPYHSVFEYEGEAEINALSTFLPFVQAVKNRLESLTTQKYSYSLFPGLKKPSVKRKKVQHKKGLKGIEQPVTDEPQPENEPVAETVATVKPVATGNLRPGSIAYNRQQRANEVREYYIIPDPEIAKFLGKIEKKKKESVVITIAAEQGSGKSRFLFQLMETFGQNYKGGHASMEEHPESSLYEDKVIQYLSEHVQATLANPEIKSYEDFEKLVAENEIVFVDSWAKLLELRRGLKLDQDLRKKYDGKLFIIIYQLTTSGTMRGGSDSQFDGDIILFGEKSQDYRENKIITNKNRYNDIPACDLKFNIYTRKMVTKTEPEAAPQQPETVATPVATQNTKLIFEEI